MMLYVGEATTSGALNSTLPLVSSKFRSICATILISPLWTMQDPTNPKSTFLFAP